MALTTDQCNALAQDGNFRLRLRSLFMLEAVAAYQNTADPQYNTKKALAIKLLNTPSVADTFADVMVTRTNLINSNLSYDASKRALVTDATDAAIRSQIATDFGMLAGV